MNNLEGGVSTFATDFYEKLINTYPAGTQIDIVAHSLGGLITREMLRLHRSQLENSGIMFGRRWCLFVEVLVDVTLQSFGFERPFSS